MQKSKFWFISFLFSQNITMFSSGHVAKIRSIKHQSNINNLTLENEHLTNNFLNSISPIRTPQELNTNTPPSNGLFRKNSLVNSKVLNRSSGSFQQEDSLNSFKSLSPKEISLEQEYQEIKNRFNLLSEPNPKKKQQWLKPKSLAQNLANQARVTQRQQLTPDQRKAIDEKMFAAIQKDDPVKLKQALDQGADPNIKNEWNFTPLHLAKSGSVTQVLLDANADPNITGHEGLLPIQTHNNSTEKVRLLLQAGSDTRNLNDDFAEKHLRLLKIETKKELYQQKKAWEQYQNEENQERFPVIER